MKQQNRHQLPLELADKWGKRTHIDVLNSAMQNDTFKFKPNMFVYKQMSSLEWNDKQTTESNSFPADLADALLYRFHEMLQLSQRAHDGQNVARGDA